MSELLSPSGVVAGRRRLSDDCSTYKWNQALVCTTAAALGLLSAGLPEASSRRTRHGAHGQRPACLAMWLIERQRLLFPFSIPSGPVRGKEKVVIWRLHDLKAGPAVINFGQNDVSLNRHVAYVIAFIDSTNPSDACLQHYRLSAKVDRQPTDWAASLLTRPWRRT